MTKQNIIEQAKTQVFNIVDSWKEYKGFDLLVHHTEKTANEINDIIHNIFYGKLLLTIDMYEEVDMNPADNMDELVEMSARFACLENWGEYCEKGGVDTNSKESLETVNMVIRYLYDQYGDEE